MRIGLDLDNTLVCYKHVFLAIAKREGLLASDFHGDKRQVRETLRQRPNGERAWMALQGQVYGRYMKAADMFAGVDSFLLTCRKIGFHVFIVSHKTQFGHYDTQHVDLRNASLAWMNDHKFFSPNHFAINPDDVTFTNTRDKKIDHIRSLNLDVFIDDLEEVLGHPNFPESTRAIQFISDSEHIHEPPWACYTSWSDIVAALFPDTQKARPLPEYLAKNLCRNPKITVNLTDVGGNNTLWRVAGSTPSVALKIYDENPFETRDRRATEHTALTFLKARGEQSIPQILNSDPIHHASLLSWIDGESISAPSNDDIIQAVHFLSRLRNYSQHPDAAQLPLASEACLSGADLFSQVKNRFDKLGNVACLYPELESFLNLTLLPALNDEGARLNDDLASLLDPISSDERILSPSDFGFHNALRQSNGELMFLDFEYFGWDDPVKLVADFLLHPAMSLSLDQKQLFLNGVLPLFNETGKFARRLQGHYPLYALRWCAIVLNPFIAQWRTVSRTISENELAAIKEIRLKRSINIYNTVFLKDRRFPYVI